MPRRDFLDMFVLGDEPAGRVSVRGKTVTRKDAIKMLELAARATDKQKSTYYLLLPISLCAAPCATRSAASRAEGVLSVENKFISAKNNSFRQGESSALNHAAPFATGCLHAHQHP